MMPVAPFSSSTRWCPTPEQRMILKELYSRGITNPNSSQIQRITAHLSLYGKIHGKNVFYWFQNHKARDRQKLKKKQLLLPISNQLHLPHYHHHHCYSFADPLLLQAQVAFQSTHDHHHASEHDDHHHHLPRIISTTFPAACCGNITIRPLQTLQLFPLTSHVDHQNITAHASHL